MKTLQMSLPAVRGLVAAGLAALGLLAACGGGGGGTTAAADATAYTQGAINGFGSIIVNGVRFDDTAASVSDDDGGAGELKLGMQVEVESGRIDDNGGQRSAAAKSIHFGSSMVGPARNATPDAAGSATGSFTVLSQAVVADSTTVFDSNLAGGVAKLATLANPVVEVHAQFDSASSTWRATRVELKTGTVAAFKLRGTVSALNAGAKTFKIGAATIAYGTATEVPAALADGQRVRVRLATTANADGSWNALTVRSGERRVEDHAEAHLHGLVSDFTDSTHFSVDGLAVDATGASFPDGTAGLAKGVAVEVEGAVVNGVLVATKVELGARHGEDDSHKNELHGSISSVDSAKQTFVLRGVTVSFAGSPSFQRGTAADLVVNAKVEVKGTLGADGVTVVATLIKFDD